MSQPRTQTEIRNALEIIRDAGEAADPTYRQIVDEELRSIWTRIQQRPNSYLMSDLEFAIFNRGRDQYRNATAQRAVERYWANRRRT